MLRLRQISAIAKVTVLDNLRKQILQVVLILTLGAIGSTTLLTFFDVGVQVKILKDLSIAAILVCGGVMAIAVSVGGIPSDLQSRTAYTSLARPIRRTDFLLARYVGTVITCGICMGIIGGVFLAILGVYEHRFDAMVALGMAYVLLEVAVLAAVGVFFSTFLTPMVSATLTLFVFILGQIKVGYLHAAIERNASPAARLLLEGLYCLAPNLECFSFKDALVHDIPMPSGYLLLVAAYGLAYLSFVIAAAGAVFERKEL